MLSTTSIAKELGKNLIVYPFKEKRLKGIGYNLTVSRFAWSLKNKARLKTNAANTHLIVEPGDTALIETNETVWVSKKIGGTFQSKVDRMSEGFSAISTTLDPGWIGPLLIAITNQTSNPIELRIEDSFTTLIFHYIKKAPIPKTINGAARLDRLAALGIKLDEEFHNWYNHDFRTSRHALKTIFKTDEDYVAFKKKKKRLILLTIISPYIPAATIFIAIVYFSLIGGFSKQQQIGGFLVALIAAISFGYNSINKQS
jgi:deoxycytidine triphosphate deaminase